MCKEIEPCCTPVAPPWETPQVIPAQLRRVNNLIFRRIGQISRANGVEAVTPMHGRLKQLVLTEKGRQFHENTMLALHQTDEYVASLLTEEENTELLRLLNKLYLGLK